MKKILLIFMLSMNIISVQASEVSSSPWSDYISKTISSNLDQIKNHMFNSSTAYISDISPANLFMYSIFATMIASSFKRSVDESQEIQNELATAWKKRFPLIKDQSNNDQSSLITVTDENNSVGTYGEPKLPLYTQGDRAKAAMIEVFGPMIGLDQSLRYNYLPYTKEQEDYYRELDKRYENVVIRQMILEKRGQNLIEEDRKYIAKEDFRPLTQEELKHYYYLRRLLELGGKKFQVIFTDEDIQPNLGSESGSVEEIIELEDVK